MARMTETQAAQDHILNEKQAWLLIENHGSAEKARAHINAINDLIPLAERYASEQGGVSLRSYDRAFHQKMNELAREAGLRR